MWGGEMIVNREIKARQAEAQSPLTYSVHIFLYGGFSLDVSFAFLYGYPNVQ